MSRPWLAYICLLAGCADEEPPIEYPHCDDIGVPYTTEYDFMNREKLTCGHVKMTIKCLSCPCFQASMTSTETRIACVSECSSLDEAACSANDQCFVARLRAAVEAGESGFIGCYRASDGDSSSECATRPSYKCTDNGTCSALYEDDGRFGLQFAACVDEI
jgi:hypothetical protein